MKIVALETYLLRDQPQVPYTWRDGLPPHQATHDMCLLRVVTDEGVDGWAGSGKGVIAADVVRRALAPVVIGQDALLREALWELVWQIDRLERLPLDAFGMLDTALWDIAGKVAGMPVWQLLGGARTRVQAYASTVTWPTVDDYLQHADECLKVGYRAIKLHAWGDVERDGKLAAKLRKHVGADVELMYDGSAGFRYEEALRLGHYLEEAKYLWYEEPMREYGIDHYRRLREKLDIPILAPETSPGVHYNAADYAVFGATDILRISVGIKGGVTGAMRIAHLADALGMYAEVHGGGMANLQLSAAIPNTRYYETLVVQDPWRERDGHGALAIDAEGYVTAPQDPGMGTAQDPQDLLRRGAELVRID